MTTARALGRQALLSVCLALFLGACASSAPDDTALDGGLSQDARVARQPCEPPLLFGHRGAYTARPENTIPAFVYAMEAGGDGIEIDVRVTKDGAIVAMHDSRTGRTTDDAANRYVSELTLAELKELDAGSWLDPSYAGTRIPTLEEIVAAVPEHTLLLLDLKGAGIATAIVDEVHRLGIEGRTYAYAFDLESLQIVRAGVPEAPLVYNPSVLSDAEFERSRGVGVEYIRIPKNAPAGDNQGLVVERGFRPAVGGSNVQWNGGIGLVNSMVRTVERKTERKPAHCP